MAITVSFNGSPVDIPEVGDSWGQNVTDYLVAIASGTLQPNGGTFTLSQDVDFGANFGLRSTYYKSRGTVASAGILRLANDQSIGWRNAANGADKLLKVNSSDQLEFDGNPMLTLALGAANTVLKMNSDGDGYEWGAIANANIASGAAIAYSKLSLSGSIVNADVASGAAIAYSKLALTGSIVNADVKSDAAIAVSKLAALTASRAVQTSASGVLEPSAVTSTELGYLDGVTSAIQTQLDGKEPTLTGGTSAQYFKGDKTLGTFADDVAATAAVSANTAKTFDSLAPTTTKGDIAAHDGTANVRVPVGSDGQVLSADSNETSGLKWISALANPMTTEGDIIIGGTSGAATRLALGTDNQILRKSGSTLAWVDGLATADDPGLVQTFDNANGDKNLASGTYTPTPSYTNVSGGTVNPFNYARVGNIVTVSGSITGLTVTTGGSDISIEFDLPFPPTNNFSGTPDASGHGTCVFSRSTGTINQDSGRVAGNTGTKNAVAVVESTKYGSSNDGIVFYFTFMYRI